jgi:hypothetical protein
MDEILQCFSYLRMPFLGNTAVRETVIVDISESQLRNGIVNLFFGIKSFMGMASSTPSQ